MSGTKNNRELYKEVFSRLHASETVIREEEKMRNAKSRLRCSKLVAACASIALLIGATSGITYAATDGATANPIEAIKVYINGQEYDAGIEKNEDGSFTVHMKSGDTVDIDAPDGSVSTSVTVEGTEDKELDLNVSEDGSLEVAVGESIGESAEESPEK